MKIDITQEEYELLVGLVESRVGELHPEIRRSRTYETRDELQHDLSVLRGLLERLQAQKPQGESS